MSTVKANTIGPASGGTVTITGAALTTPALGTPASGTLTNCTGFPAGSLAGATLAAGVTASSLTSLGTIASLSASAITCTGTVDATGDNLNLGRPGAVSVLKIGSAAPSNDSGTRLTMGNSNAVQNWQISTNIFTGGGALDFVPSTAAGGFTFTTAVLTLLPASITASANYAFSADNAYSLATAANRSSVVYSATALINTSDAREKTLLRPLNERERACALELAKTGPGVFQWLDAVAEKGADRARLHVGFTVQQVMTVMQKHGLDPTRYGCICYDEWEDKFDVFPEVPAKPAVAAQPARYEKRIEKFLIVVDGQEVEAEREYLLELSPAVAAQPAAEYRAERRVQTQWAGNRWGFRSNQLTDWIVGTTLKAVVERAGL